MGGTLPLMFNCFVRPERYRNSAVGLLYGLNTLGAALGVLAAPFVLLSRRSIPSTLALVGVGNLLLGVAIWLYGRRIAPLEDAPPSEHAATDDGDAALPLVLTLGFLWGFISLASEVSLFRAFSIFNPSSPYNFPGVLLPFLVSIAVGSIVLTRFREYTPARS